MPYHLLKDPEHTLEKIPEMREPEVVEGSDTDVETAQFDTDESSSFLGQKLKDGGRRSRGALPQGALSAATPFIVTLIPWVINFILTIALVSLSWETATSRTETSHQPPVDMMYTLAADRIEYKLDKTYASQQSPASAWQGWPNDENDKLWEEYNKGNRIRIDREMAEKLPQMTEHVPMEEYKDEYVVGLAAFHTLHCLSTLRKSIYPHRYNWTLLDDNGMVDYSKWYHIDHCFEIIRKALECHGDTAAMTFMWIEDSQLTMYPEVLHTCRNFDLIRDWAYERYVPVHQRSHVEDGKVVDYLGKPYGPAWDKVKVVVPDDWAYTDKDL